MQFANTVLWLEDQKIRQYKIEDREALRAIGTTPEWETNWEAAYAIYRNDVGMPAELLQSLEQLSWLLSVAVRWEYTDNSRMKKTKLSIIF